MPWHTGLLPTFFVASTGFLHVWAQTYVLLLEWRQLLVLLVWVVGVWMFVRLTARIGRSIAPERPWSAVSLEIGSVFAGTLLFAKFFLDRQYIGFRAIVFVFFLLFLAIGGAILGVLTVGAIWLFQRMRERFYA